MGDAGKVLFVGAGPGDPGLITAKGLDCLRRADAVVYDGSLDRRLLAGSKPGAKLIAIGADGQVAHGAPDEVADTLRALAAGGRIVVRLVRGDPFSSRSSVAEIEALAAAGTGFEIVPGISEAFAAPTYAGIPLSLADTATLTIADGGSGNRVDAQGTLVITGVREPGEACAGLIASGVPGDTAAAIINIEMPARQRTVVCTLSELAAQVDQGQDRSPAVLVVGRAVEQRERFRWLDRRPLFGQRVLVTRAREQAGALNELLEEEGATPVELATVSIQPLARSAALDAAISRLASYRWAIFTSVNGVDHFFQRLLERGQDARALKGVKLCAIGPATAKALGEHGLLVDYVPGEYVAEAVVAGLLRQGAAGQRILLPRALEAREVIVKDLTAAGATVDEVSVYQTILPEGSAAGARALFERGEIDIATFTSSSTVRNLVGMLAGDVSALLNVTTACIGPITAETALGLGIRVDVVAAEHTIPGLVRAIVKFWRERV